MKTFIFIPRNSDCAYKIEGLSKEDVYRRLVSYYYKPTRSSLQKKNIANAMVLAEGDIYELRGDQNIQAEPFRKDLLLSEIECYELRDDD